MKIIGQVFLISWFMISACCIDTPVLAETLPTTSTIFSSGLNNVRQQSYQQALIDFTQVIDRQEEDSDLVGSAHSNRCLVDLQLQNPAAATTDCTIAIQYDPDNFEAKLNLGLAYYRQGKYDRAIAQYAKIVQKNSQDYRVYYNRGLSYLALNNYQKAIADYDRALLYSPDSDSQSKSSIYNDLALAYVMSSQTESAISNLDRAIAINSSNYNAYYNRGCVYHKQGKYEAAVRDFTAAVRLNSALTQAYVHRAILNHQLGAMDMAFADLNLAIEQYQNQGDREQYKATLDLKHQLFYAQLSQMV